MDLDAVRLRELLERTSVPAVSDDSDYRIVSALGPAYLARGRAGEPVLLVPLPTPPSAAGRRGGGFALTAMGRVVFRTGNQEWEQPAAVLSCTESELVGAFLVLVADIVTRMTTASSVDWVTILQLVDEWQVLLAHRPILQLDQQLGLWGELWTIAKVSHPDLLVDGWRGPDYDAADFFANGIAVEVKASRRAHVHHISRRQVVRPAGEHDAFVLSIWAGIDPARGESLSELVDRLLASVADPALFLAKVARIGYVPVDRAAYSTRFVLLEEPLWFRAEDVPQVRQVDAGVSDVRYLVTLDTDRALEQQSAAENWRRFSEIKPTV
jgi:hypothetical protein